MDFALLQQRLVALIRSRVRNGEVTERGLARLAGVSQPHIHNVLKGVRGLSLEMADTLIRHLHVDFQDLLAGDELHHGRVRLIPVARQPLGPGFAISLEPGGDLYPFRSGDVQHLESPLAARLGDDPSLPGPLQAGDWVLLDRAIDARRRPDGALYCLQLDGAAVIRGVLQSGRGGLMVHPRRSISLAERDILEVVKAKVVWFGRRLEHYSIDPT
jgi:hypothetical protein